jgi:S-methylmethionine-dependent homocysteine/selenocysteine methylase/SAM-dependent methyltransferase
LEVEDVRDQRSDAYQRVQRLITGDECVILDGGVATELERSGLRDYRISDENLWGTWALYHAPYAALDVHRRYVSAGCDIISTDTWAIIDAPEMEARSMAPPGGPSHWMDIARLGIRLARQAIEETKPAGQCAVAFSINGDIDRPQRLGTLQLLGRVFDESPPDLILMETLSLIRENLTVRAIETVLQTGLPVWLSFRRCRNGVCGVYGQHWGGPEGDSFGRAARDFEKMGVGALLINCLPADHVPGMLPWLRDFTDLPLGVYPNLGRYLDPGWKFDERIGPEAFGDLALEWRKEGARIIGGCCGVTPEHIAAAREKLIGTKPGRRAEFAAKLDNASVEQPETQPASPVSHAWVDDRGRKVYPLPFPEIVCDANVFHPTQGSFLIWKHLFRTGLGQGKRCLEIGCGSGILSVQLALNGAEHVHAIDIQSEAVANTLANCFRNGVADRVSATVTDLYTYISDQKYDVIIASLYQMPVDPLGDLSSHRPVDFWGRNQVDHLISLLPDLLKDDGTAYVMQISILGQLRTAELLERAGLDSKLIDFSFFEFSPVFRQNLEQILRVEQLSDAYHLTFGESNVLVMYLIEVTRRRSAQLRPEQRASMICGIPLAGTRKVFGR